MLSGRVGRTPRELEAEQNTVQLNVLTYFMFRTKTPILEIFLVPSGHYYPMEPGRQPTVQGERRLRVGAAFALSLVDLFNDRPFARLNHIGSVVALDVAIVTQPRRFPIDRLGEGSDLHGLWQALADPDPCTRSAAAGGALFCPGRTRVFADDLAILVEKTNFVRRRCRARRGRRLSA